MKKNKKTTVIILNIIAVLFAIYSLVKVYMSYTYISSLVAQGLVISQELLNVVDYFVGSASPYIFYAVAIWAIGYIISKLDNMTNETKEVQIEETVLGESEILEATEDTVVESVKFDTVEVSEADAFLSEEDEIKKDN